jgi:hypothetical protein
MGLLRLYMGSQFTSNERTYSDVSMVARKYHYNVDDLSRLITPFSPSHPSHPLQKPFLALRNANVADTATTMNAIHMKNESAVVALQRLRSVSQFAVAQYQQPSGTCSFDSMAPQMMSDWTIFTDQYPIRRILRT